MTQTPARPALGLGEYRIHIIYPTELSEIFTVSSSRRIELSFVCFNFPIRNRLHPWYPLGSESTQDKILLQIDFNRPTIFFRVRT